MCRLAKSNKHFIKAGINRGLKELGGMKDESQIMNKIINIMGNSPSELDGLMNVFLFGYNYKNKER